MCENLAFFLNTVHYYSDVLMMFVFDSFVLLSTTHIMADSDRSRSPVPARNRLEPPGQRQPLPNFPGPYTIYPDLSTNRNGQQLRRDLT